MPSNPRVARPRCPTQTTTSAAALLLAALLFAALLFAALLAACSDELDVAVTGNADGWLQVDGGALTPGAAAIPPSRWQRCGQIAEAYCIALARCWPHAYEIDYAEHSVCVGREQLRCSLNASAPGSGGLADGTAACAATFASATCDDVALGGAYGCVYAAGKGEIGAACVLDTQCASARCGFTEAASGCASCIAPKASPKAAIDCSAATSQQRPCGHGKVCVDGACVPEGLAGDACGSAGCNHAIGLACHQTDKVCAPIPMAPAGSGCNMWGYSADIFSECRDSRCMNRNDQGKGGCQPYADDGEPCADWEGPPCRPPAACIEGRCRLIDGRCDGG